MGDFAVLQNSDSFADSMGIFGTAVTGGGAGNTKGAWVEMIASLTRPICGILFSLHNAPAGYQLMDIGIGPSGGEVVVAPNLTVSQSLSGTHANKAFWFPISLPAGTRVALRSQSSAASGFLVAKGFFVTDAFAGIQAPTRWIDWGTDLTASRGTQFTNGSGAKGAWTAIVAATDFTTRWLMVEIQGETAPVDMAIDIGIGPASGEVVIFPDIHYTVENLAIVLGPFPFTIPKGTRIAVRGQAGGQTCRAMLHGGA